MYGYTFRAGRHFWMSGYGLPFRGGYVSTGGLFCCILLRILEPVADAAHRLQLEAASDRPQPAPYKMNVIVEVAFLDFGVRPPDAQKDHGARKRLRGIFEEKGHQISLPVR